MTGRLTAGEIAGLPGLPATAAGVEALARGAGWTARWEGGGVWSYAATDVFETAFTAAAAEKDRLDRELCELAAALAILWARRPAATARQQRRPA